MLNDESFVLNSKWSNSKGKAVFTYCGADQQNKEKFAYLLYLNIGVICHFHGCWCLNVQIKVPLPWLKAFKCVNQCQCPGCSSFKVLRCCRLGRSVFHHAATHAFHYSIYRSTLTTQLSYLNTRIGMWKHVLIPRVSERLRTSQSFPKMVMADGWRGWSGSAIRNSPLPTNKVIFRNGGLKM